MRDGTLCVALLASLALAGCNDDYPLPPTPCDDYCLATQRADCSEDWPDECVRTCEFTRSPKSYPDCSGDFDALLHCYEGLGPHDFTCEADRSAPLPGRCENEERALNFCTAPIIYRCIELCQTRGQRCTNVDPNSCFRACYSRDQCDNARIRYLDCELADGTACDPSPDCTALSVELSDCLNP